MSVSCGEAHSLLFDYGGFPPESYEYTYSAPGAPDVAARVSSLLAAAGVKTTQDPKRGWDHGVFVPLKLMFPDARVPVVALSLHSSLDPELHINIGRALAPLREEGVLIIGSGMSFHNFGYFFARDARTRESGVRHSKIWNDYLVDTLVSGSHPREEQLARLKAWTTGPSGTEAHPLRQEEHLIPLHVVLGAAAEGDKCSLVGEPGKGGRGLPDMAFSNFEWRPVD